jgi:hypothetical protein
MRYRAGQALAIALDKSLHAEMGNDEFSEARRRAWWMTYYCVIQGSIVSTTMPAIVINDPQFTTPYPSFSSDAEVCTRRPLRYLPSANRPSGLVYLDTSSTSACIGNPVYW